MEDRLTRLEERIETLDRTTRLETRVHAIDKFLYAAGVVAVIFGVVGAWGATTVASLNTQLAETRQQVETVAARAVAAEDRAAALEARIDAFDAQLGGMTNAAEQRIEARESEAIERLRVGVDRAAPRLPILPVPRTDDPSVDVIDTLNVRDLQIVNEDDDQVVGLTQGPSGYGALTLRGLGKRFVQMGFYADGEPFVIASGEKNRIALALSTEGYGELRFHDLAPPDNQQRLLLADSQQGIVFAIRDDEDNWRSALP